MMWLSVVLQNYILGLWLCVILGQKEISIQNLSQQPKQKLEVSFGFR